MLPTSYYLLLLVPYGKKRIIFIDNRKIVHKTATGRQRVFRQWQVHVQKGVILYSNLLYKMGSQLLGHTVEAKLWQKNLILWNFLCIPPSSMGWKDAKRCEKWKDGIWDKLAIHKRCQKHKQTFSILKNFPYKTSLWKTKYVKKFFNMKRRHLRQKLLKHSICLKHR